MKIEDLMGDTSYSIGNRKYLREAGVWYEVVKQRNPLYQKQDQYFILFGNLGSVFMVFCKMAEDTTNRSFQRAILQIAKSLGYVKPKSNPFNGDRGGDRLQVERVEKGLYEARVLGRKPGMAFEINLDGSWKKTSR